MSIEYPFSVKPLWKIFEKTVKAPRQAGPPLSHRSLLNPPPEWLPGAIPKLSARYFSTLGETNAGKRGAKTDIFDSQIQKAQKDAYRFLLIPGQHQRQRKLINSAPESIRQSQGNLHRAVGGPLHCPHIHQPGQTGHRAKIQIVETVIFPHARVRTTESFGVRFTKFRIIVSSRSGPRHSRPPGRNG